MKQALWLWSLVLVLLLPGAASALTLSEHLLGPLAPGATPLGSQLPADEFLDVYSFELSQPAIAIGVIVPRQLDNELLPGPEFITAIAFVALLDAADQPLAVDGDPVDAYVVPALLPAGAYRLVVQGVAAGLLGGLYDGVLLLQAQPVAEPASAALWLAGGLLLLLRGARRSRR
ncbi:MAG: hypothetical protein KBC73_23105 [Burkholderiaceae bacterium]|nr:hypothetical protein [Burkholderiaceae bacterium]